MWNPTDQELKTYEEQLRQAGCICEKPLIGFRPGVGPRCRTCNTVFKEKTDEIEI